MTHKICLALCSKDCKNEGRCELVEKEENGLGFLQETCVCPDTFSGEYCEQNIQLGKCHRIKKKL